MPTCELIDGPRPNSVRSDSAARLAPTGEAGGVKHCTTPDAVKEAAAKMLGTKMITYQSAGRALPCDPAERVPRTGYQSVTAATRTYRPVAPLPWDELNRRVTPRPKAEPPAGQQK